MTAEEAENSNYMYWLKWQVQKSRTTKSGRASARARHGEKCLEGARKWASEVCRQLLRLRATSSPEPKDQDNKQETCKYPKSRGAVCECVREGAAE